MPSTIWNLPKVKYGLERFISEHGRPPTARLYFVVANTSLHQNSIDNLLMNKRNKLPKNYTIATIETFSGDIAAMKAYRISIERG